MEGKPVKKIDDFNAQDRINNKLLDNGVHFLLGEIEDGNISETIKWIVYENLDKKQEKVLTLYINSSGGDLYQAFALIDVMRVSTHKIRTIGMGNIMSAAFLIFTSGATGERYIAPNTGIMCHQFTDGVDAKYHDIKAQMKESDYCNTRMVNILKEATGLDTRSVKNKLLPASDVYLTADELIELGVADHIFQEKG
jgi:ATP-dependent Clp protease protease subunit